MAPKARKTVVSKRKSLRRDIVVVGASAGGLEALRALVAGLPADFPAALFIVWHVAPESPSYLVQYLSRYSAVPVEAAQDGAPLVPGRVVVAVPDRHLLLARGHMRLAYGPKENRFRPSVDALFRSAAVAYGARVIGVVLSGMLDDGTAGLWAIKDRGGLAVVQDPAEAKFDSMPIAAALYVQVDASLPVSQIPAQLMQWMADPAPAANGQASTATATETAMAENEDPLDLGLAGEGEPTMFVCPECEGALLRLKGGGIPRFRCHTGHAYSIHSLLAEISKAAEQKLWSAARVIEEQELLLHHLADHFDQPSQRPVTEALQRRAQTAEKLVKQLRGILETLPPMGAEAVLKQQALTLEMPAAPAPPAAGNGRRTAKKAAKRRAAR
jgi:two-component system chemotaxis response regulator CheB